MLNTRSGKCSRYCLCLFLLFLLAGFAGLKAQDTSQTDKPLKRPKVIFNSPGLQSSQVVYDSSLVSQADSLKQLSASDSTPKPRIVFKKNLLLEENNIVLISEDRFRFGGVENPMGTDGELLKKAMSSNPDAMKMVDNAYGKKTLGTVLMGVGAAIIVAGIAVQSTWVETKREQQGGVTFTSYWIPGVTVGGLVGALGYVQFTSVYRRLIEAVDFFNSKKN